MAADAPTPAVAMDTADPTPAGGEVERLIADIEHQISHLVRSNQELEEFMSENGQEKELREAIGENIVTIAKRRAIIADLRKQHGLADDAPPMASGAATPAAAASATAAEAEQPSSAAAADGAEGVYL